MDEDKDFAISREEFQKAIGKLPTQSRREMALMRAFQRMDKDGSGSLSKAELFQGSMLRNVGLSQAQIDDLISFVFTDDDKAVQYDEFLRLLNFKESESTIKQLFSKLDKDGSGALSAAEMRDAINKEGDLARVRPQLLKVLDEIEKDFLGRNIDFNRFVEVWLQKKEVIKTESFASNPYI
ncbi:calmodulin [Elysia marginata]|uniref:Calmodulin n=1 Tax=Elysia marginata TaxID=1093978 RepID=A0AAV4J8V2_9GAST|nr:calmodulin [Elysia marginata]